MTRATGGLVVGLGSDLVEIPRFRLALERRPKLAERLFSDGERAYADRFREPAPHLAARFGAKEAVMKALGVGLWRFAMRDPDTADHTLCKLFKFCVEANVLWGTDSI